MTLESFGTSEMVQSMTAISNLKARNQKQTEFQTQQTHPNEDFTRRNIAFNEK
jgi:hypothetical protein